MSYRLDFAPHLGFPTPDSPLFAELVGSADPVEHLQFAVAHGFTAVQDPFTAMRSETEQARIGAAARQLGLRLGCFVYCPLPEARTPAWSVTTAADRATLSRSLDHAFEIAERINSRHIAILNGLNPAQTASEQRRAMAENLHWAGEKAAARDVKLCVEAVHARRLPGMLLNHIADAIEVVRSATHPAVRLIFDFAHVQAMDGDILHQLDQTWSDIEIIQVADNPNRVEPGAGELNFDRLLDALVAKGYRGLCELEHRWSKPGQDLQRAYLSWLERWRTPSGLASVED